MRFAALVIWAVTILSCGAGNGNGNGHELNPKNHDRVRVVWHCVEVNDSLNGDVIAHCFPTHQGCANALAIAQSQKLFVSTCTQSHSAVCYVVTDKDMMTDRRRCMRTVKQCESTRLVDAAKKLQVTECIPSP